MEFEDLMAKVEALAAAPKTWRTTLHYSDGTTAEIDQPTEKQCRNIASRYERMRKSGHEYISREHGGKIRIVNITVENIAQ